MTWRAHIDGGGDFFTRTVRLMLADQHPDGSYSVLRQENGLSVLTRVTDGSALPDGPVGYELPSDALHAVLAALSRHLGAVEHPEQLRRDYDAERARVDKLIDNLMGRPA